MKQSFVKELRPGQSLCDRFVIVEARQLTSRNGPYWNLVLQDATGRIDAKIWSPLAASFSELPAGRCALVSGTVDSFRDKNQIIVESLDLAPEGEPLSDPSLFMPSSEIPPQELYDALLELLREQIPHKPLRQLCMRVLQNEEVKAKLLAAPGAKTVHHAYLGGLLEHTLSVTRLCLAFCDHYPALDRQVLLAAAALHDLGKAWELSGGLAPDYTDEGKLLGHIVIGLEKIQPFLARASKLDPEVADHLKHIIISHHGQYEFGSPRVPLTPEAMALHYADNLDAKLNTMAGALEPLEGENVRWTPYVRFLDRSLFKAAPTPDPASDNDKKKKADTGQCLLPLKA